MAYNRAGLVGNALRDLHEDEVVDAVIADSFFLSVLEKTDPEEFQGGEELYWLVDMRANPSYRASQLDGDPLPQSGNRKQVRAKANILNHLGSTGVTQAAIDRTTTKGAFFRAVDKARKELVDDLRAKVSPQLYKPVRFSVTTGGSNVTTVELDSVQYIRVGDRLVFGLAASPYTVVGVREVVAKNIANSTVDLNSAITLGATHAAWYDGTGPGETIQTDSLALAATGLTTRILHGISSATYDEWRGNEKSLGGQAPTEADISAMANKMWERGADVTEAMSSAGVQDRISQSMQLLKRFTDGNAVKLNGGFTGLAVSTPRGEIPVVAERNVPKGYCFLWDKSVVRYHRGAAGFLTPPEGGSIWRYKRNSNGEALSEFEATYRLQLNVLWENPAGAGMLTNCEDDDPVW